MTDAASLSGNAKGKSLEKINHDIDSLNQLYDSIGRIYLNEANVRFYGGAQRINKKDSLKEIKKGEKLNFDTLYNKLPQDKKLMAVNQAQSTVQQELSDLDFKSMSTSDADYMIRQHKIEAINKFTLALSCLIFFFIGAPLGAIIEREVWVSLSSSPYLCSSSSLSSTIQDTECQEAECGPSGSVKVLHRQY